MERGVWNQKILHAFEVADDSEEEKLVRAASRRGEITCPDPECSHPVLKYCHGEVVVPYFAHRTKGGCDYAAYDETNTEELILIRRSVAEALKAHGIDVREEQKVLDHHYADLTMLRDGELSVAELIRLKPRVDTVQRLIDAYKEKGLTVSWIMPEATMIQLREDRLTKKRLEKLQFLAELSTVTVSKDRKSVRQQRRDPDQYVYNGRVLRSGNYPDVYREAADIRHLTLLQDGTIGIGGFDLRYEKWHANKQSAFQKQIELLKRRDEEERKRREDAERRREEERRRREEEEKKRREEADARRHVWAMQAAEERRIREEEREKDDRISREIRADQKKRADAFQRALSAASNPAPDPAPASDPDVLCAETPGQLPELLKQQKKIVMYNGHRMVRCEICGKIAPSEEFGSYGGMGRMNLGVCRDCQRQQ